MIISQTPLRMSFVGGGSDLPSFYRRWGGAVLSTAIDKYVYVSVNRKFDGGIRLAYSRTEEVTRRDQIEHRLFKAAFEALEIEGGIEIATMADIPSQGSGLGSSSSFTVGVVQAVAAYLGRHVSAADLARQACEIEIERCQEPIGKQDQYAAAFGGLNLIEFNPDDSVNVLPVILRAGTRARLQDELLVFYTGGVRSASAILKAQSEAADTEPAVQGSLKRMVELAYVLRDELSGGNVEGVGEILRENWSLKKRLAAGITNPEIEAWHDAAISAGATGGKLLGAGAGGFLMFHAPLDRHDAVEKAVGLRRVRMKFEPLGARIPFYNPATSEH
jgi:D-glycero-alpha-D-manno-heptose-7-phosphate kinase